jgi:hypothetical protein
MFGRLYDIWIGDEDAELRNMIEEFRVDYGLDEKFMYTLELIESAVAEQDYEGALTLLQFYTPTQMSRWDYNIFEQLLLDAQYGI